ncbi:unnamed protein product, partial [Leptidea sinapis]
MLGIQPASLPASPRASEDEGRKHGDIDDISSDVLHLDIWDHDDESSVLDAVSRLNEVRGVRGLGRFFKQVCQSCVNIPLREIPSTGIEAWYKLDARSQRSSVQGRIRLRLWLSAPEGAESESHTWEGDLCGAAQTLLHQHAVQGDMSPLQAAIARYAAACRLNSEAPLDPKYMFKQLNELESEWRASEALVGSGSGDAACASRDEERWLADCFGEFVDRALHQLRLHRDLLEYLLRCLSFVSQMRAFWRCCPFSKEMSLYHMRMVWRSIGGAEEGTLVGSVRLLEAACATALHYADLVHGALADQGYYENHAQDKTTGEICTIVNNLEYVRRSLAEYDDEHAITPLLEFLDQHLSTLNTWLLPRAFSRSLAACWNSVLKEVSSQADSGGAEKPRVYHQRLKEALDLLAEFFHAEGKVHNAEWKRLEQRMQYHQAPTEELIELWLADRLEEQARTPLPSPYGSILIRVYFNHDSLCV